MFGTTDFLSDPTLSDIQAGINDTDLILILTPNARVPVRFKLATFKVV